MQITHTTLIKTAKLSLAFLWVFTGLTSLFFAPELGYQILAKANITGDSAHLIIYGGALLDICLGFWFLSSWKLKTCCLIQITTIVIYTLLLSIIEPTFWLHPFGPLTKNIPIIILILLVLVHDEPKRLKS